MTAELLITQVKLIKLHNLDNDNKLDVSNSLLYRFVSIIYIVMYLEN